MTATSMNAPNLTCAIIDDEIAATDRLREILKDFESVEITGVYNTYQDALDHLQLTRPEVIFMDIELDRNHTAFELIDQFHSVCYFPHVILITAFEHYSIKAIKKRVFDYIVKPIDIEELKDTLHRLGKHIQTPSSSIIDNNGSMTSREKQVLEQVLQGKTSQEIAELLFVSKSTIDTHRKNILKKTGAKSISDLMRLSHVL
jgi:two-component system response regulator NreC